MKYLLDSHALLWIVNDDLKPSKACKNTYLNSENEIFINLASIWEMVIKIQLNKLQIPSQVPDFANEHILGNDVSILPIQLFHIFQIEKLPLHHRDPFDRLIVSQALEENMNLVSRDESLDRYSIIRIW